MNMTRTVTVRNRSEVSNMPPLGASEFSKQSMLSMAGPKFYVAGLGKQASAKANRWSKSKGDF